MSQSTDAIIAYGVDFGEEPNFPWLDEDGNGELDVWWAKENGVPAPTCEFSDENKAEWRAYWGKKNALEKICPVEVISHCSGDYPMYVLAARSSGTSASRGYPESLDLLDLIHKSQGFYDALQGFCKKYGIEIKTPAAWLLFSDWS